MSFILLGFCIGLLVSLSGIGGAILTTPALIMLGIPAITAIGTDLLFIFFTKLWGVMLQHKNRNISWRVVLMLCCGSIPASILTIFWLSHLKNISLDINWLIINGLSMFLLISAICFFLMGRISGRTKNMNCIIENRIVESIVIVLVGILLGTIITVSSIGTGSIITIIMLLLYPGWTVPRIVSTDLAFALPISLVSGIGHFSHGNVNMEILGYLLLGSLPAVFLGVKLGKKVNDKLLTKILSIILFLAGCILLYTNNKVFF